MPQIQRNFSLIRAMAGFLFLILWLASPVFSAGFKVQGQGQDHSLNWVADNKLNFDRSQKITSFMGRIFLSGAVPGEFSRARVSASRLYRIAFENIDAEVLVRLADRVMPTFIVSPDQELTQVRLRFKLSESVILPVVLGELSNEPALDGISMDKKRGLFGYTAIGDLRLLVLAAGAETLMEIPKERRGQFPEGRSPNYYVFLHEIGHAVYEGGFDEKWLRMMDRCWGDIRPSLFDNDLEREKEIVAKKEFFSNYFSFWFGTLPTADPAYYQIVFTDQCMRQLFRNLFDKRGPYGPGYVENRFKAMDKNLCLEGGC